MSLASLDRPGLPTGSVASVAQMNDTLILALIPLALFSLIWVGYCWYDISRREVRHLPKWAWALISLLSVPVGGVVYILVGREPE